MEFYKCKYQLLFPTYTNMAGKLIYNQEFDS